jgi:hypothetical protein
MHVHYHNLSRYICSTLKQWLCFMYFHISEFSNKYIFYPLVIHKIETYLPGAYAPSTQKNWSVKIFGQKFYRDISTVYVCLSNFVKTDILWCMKKEKKYHMKNLIFRNTICLFYTRQTTSQFFRRRLCRRVAREDVYAIFLFQCFHILK